MQSSIYTKKKVTIMKSQKTLTLKSIGIDIPAGGGDYIDKVVCLVDCDIEGYFLKNSQYGDSVALSGDITMVNALTGEVFQGITLYLPSDFSTMIANKLDKREDQSQTVNFKAEVLVSASEKSARGYTFITRPISTVEIVNQRLARANDLLSTLKALPSPEKAGKSKAA